MPGQPVSYSHDVRWLARFRSAGRGTPMEMAKVLWPPQKGEAIKVFPSHSSIASQIHKEGHELPGGEIDCPTIITRRLEGDREATIAGHRGAMICAMCGCWELHACAGGCWWVAPNLCSACCKRYGINPVLRAQLEPPGWESAYVVAPLSGAK